MQRGARHNDSQHVRAWYTKRVPPRRGPVAITRTKSDRGRSNPVTPCPLPPDTVSVKYMQPQHGTEGGGWGTGAGRAPRPPRQLRHLQTITRPSGAEEMGARPLAPRTTSIPHVNTAGNTMRAGRRPGKGRGHGARPHQLPQTSLPQRTTVSGGGGIHTPRALSPRVLTRCCVATSGMPLCVEMESATAQRPRTWLVRKAPNPPSTDKKEPSKASCADAACAWTQVGTGRGGGTRVIATRTSGAPGPHNRAGGGSAACVRPPAPSPLRRRCFDRGAPSPRPQSR